MTFAQILTELTSHKIGITISQDSIKTNVPASKVPDHIKELLRLNKDEIIMICAGKVLTVIYEDGVIATQKPGEEIPF